MGGVKCVGFEYEIGVGIICFDCGENCVYVFCEDEFGCNGFL